MRTQNRLTLLAEELYYRTHQYKNDLNTILKPVSHKEGIS